MRTSGEIQGDICEIQETNIPFPLQIKKINRVLNKWKAEAYNEGVADTHKKLFNQHTKR